MCSCGYTFGQDIDTVRGLLRAQLRNSWATLAVLAIANVGILGVAFFGATLPALAGLGPLVGATGRTVRKIAISRESLRQLAPRQLPQARLLTD